MFERFTGQQSFVPLLPDGFTALSPSYLTIFREIWNNENPHMNDLNSSNRLSEREKVKIRNRNIKNMRI